MPADVGGTGIRCMLMRGGTSKGAYFLAEDLPADPAARDGLLLRIMGSPDPRQIDGIGGAHPLTSKVAIISRTPGAEGVDYLFLQVGVDTATVSSRQNCGNILAGVGPFAIERGLVESCHGTTPVPIRMLNSGSLAVAQVPTPQGVVDYTGDFAIDGVPGTAARIPLAFEGLAGSAGGGALLPTGNVVDEVLGIRVTCVDNGMPSVMMDARDLGVTGYEGPADLEANQELAGILAHVRLKAASLMGLGDVSAATIPKMVLLAPPVAGGAVSTRSFLPVRCHTSIGIFGATTVAAAIQIPGSVGYRLARQPGAGEPVSVEHPTGHMDVDVHLDMSGPAVTTRSSAALRTARKLFDGVVFPRDPAPEKKTEG